MLETLVQIYIRWDNGRELRELEERQRKWKKRMEKAGQSMANLAEEMLGQDLYDGKWTFDTAYRMIAQADKTTRLALGMETDKTAVSQEVTGKDGEPLVDMTSFIGDYLKAKAQQKKGGEDETKGQE